jgi:ABC-type dipeptide/oligopeptide/nickel transport system ATPase subunit
MDLLTIEQVCKSYKSSRLSKKATVVLDRVSLAVPDGRCVALTGESGSGKSTLIRLILGLERPDSGKIRWNGRDVAGRDVSRRSLYREIQPVLQDSAGCLNPRWKVCRSLCEPLDNYLTLTSPVKREKVAELLEMVELPGSILEKYPHELSGGQQKRVCIARAIAIRPRLILLDEATAGLDATVTKKILILLKKLQKELGCSYLFITHDLKAAFYMARQIVVMKEGEMVDTVTDAQSYPDFTHPYAMRLMGSKKTCLQILSKEETK